MGCSQQTCTSVKECTTDLRFQPELSLPEVKGQAQRKMTTGIAGKDFHERKNFLHSMVPSAFPSRLQVRTKGEGKIGMGWKIKTEEEKQKRNGEQHSIENTNKGTTSLIGG